MSHHNIDLTTVYDKFEDHVCKLISGNARFCNSKSRLRMIMLYQSAASESE